jgi:large subunit ribosomal protein L25
MDFSDLDALDARLRSAHQQNMKNRVHSEMRITVAVANVYYKYRGGITITQPLQLTERTHQSRSEMNSRRKQGHIPAVVYGHQIGNISVEVSEKDITDALRRNPHAVLQVVLPKYGKQSVLVRDIQRNALSGKFRHIDFFQIDTKEKVDTKVTIHLTGDPVGVKSGGILQVELHEIEVRCMADKLFTSFEVDTSSLAIGDQLLVSDLSIHDGVEVLTDASSLVVTVLAATVTSAPDITE